MALWRKKEWIQEIQQSPISNINVFLVSAKKTLYYKPKMTKTNIAFSGAVLLRFLMCSYIMHSLMDQSIVVDKKIQSLWSTTTVTSQNPALSFGLPGKTCSCRESLKFMLLYYLWDFDRWQPIQIDKVGVK